MNNIQPSWDAYYSFSNINLINYHARVFVEIKKSLESTNLVAIEKFYFKSQFVINATISIDRKNDLLPQGVDRLKMWSFLFIIIDFKTNPDIMLFYFIDPPMASILHDMIRLHNY